MIDECPQCIASSLGCSAKKYEGSSARAIMPIGTSTRRGRFGVHVRAVGVELIERYC